MTAGATSPRSEPPRCVAARRTSRDQIGRRQRGVTRGANAAETSGRDSCSSLGSSSLRGRPVREGGSPLTKDVTDSRAAGHTQDAPRHAAFPTDSPPEPCSEDRAHLSRPHAGVDCLRGEQQDGAKRLRHARRLLRDAHGRRRAGLVQQHHRRRGRHGMRPAAEPALSGLRGRLVPGGFLREGWDAEGFRRRVPWGRDGPASGWWARAGCRKERRGSSDAGRRLQRGVQPR